MEITGIICEYNPFHLGHQKQFDLIRQKNGPDCGIVCLMSGNYVQRGMPAVIHKTLRAKAAVLSGADLVLELPVPISLSSAEGFAAGGVSILSSFCDELCFGAEDADEAALMEIARALLSDSFSNHLREALQSGASFPAARQAALSQIGLNGDLLSKPNNILAVEYCKAILSQELSLRPLPIRRLGNYHAVEADPENPSATALRALMLRGKGWSSYVPAEAGRILENASVHSLTAGERGILTRLRTMDDDEFEALPYGSEGLWRKLMHASRREASLEQIIASVKSKRYTRSRLDRMVMCAFLRLTTADLEAPVPYVRVLALNHRGREILKKARASGYFPNIGEKINHPYQQIETRCGDLYGLFAVDGPEPAGAEAAQRIYYDHKENPV